MAVGQLRVDQRIALGEVDRDLAALQAVGVLGQRGLLDRAVAGGEEHEQVLAVLAHRQDGLHLLALLQPQPVDDRAAARMRRSEEHTSELQSLMRTSYAVFCLKKN